MSSFSTEMRKTESEKVKTYPQPTNRLDCQGQRWGCHPRRFPEYLSWNTSQFHWEAGTQASETAKPVSKRTKGRQKGTHTHTHRIWNSCKTQLFHGDVLIGGEPENGGRGMSPAPTSALLTREIPTEPPPSNLPLSQPREDSGVPHGGLFQSQLPEKLNNKLHH